MSLPHPTLEELRREFKKIVEPFDVHPAYKRFATSPTHDGSPHIEQYGAKYAFVVTERGSELERRETTDPDEILYWLVSCVTFEVALKYELHHRRPDVYSRRMWIDLDVQLLSEIRSDWGKRKREEYDQVLEKHPFRDGE